VAVARQMISVAPAGNAGTGRRAPSGRRDAGRGTGLRAVRQGIRKEPIEMKVVSIIFVSVIIISCTTPPAPSPPSRDYVFYDLHRNPDGSRARTDADDGKAFAECRIMANSEADRYRMMAIATRSIDLIPLITQTYQRTYIDCMRAHDYHFEGYE
jgi:hypothetical protein